MTHRIDCHDTVGTLRALSAGVALVIPLMFAPSDVTAQTASPIELSAGYLNVRGQMKGANAQGNVEITPRWSLVGEVDWSQGRDCAGCEPVYKDIAVLGGARIRWLRDARISPFSQVLVGGLHSRAQPAYEEYCCGLGRRFQEGFTVNYLAVQPGGGVTMMLTRRVGVQVQADVQLAIPDQSEWEGMSVFPRVAFGGVVRLGRTR